MVDAPISLGGLFAEDDENTEDRRSLEQNYEVTSLAFSSARKLRVRQFAWHEANANQVWPGAFRYSSPLHWNLTPPPPYTNYPYYL